LEEVVALLDLGMVSRAVLLIALAAVLSSVTAQADNEHFPSRKANVVLPILQNYSPKGHLERQSVLSEIEKILGKPSTVSPRSTGIEGTYVFYDYVLDDAARIEILFVNDGLTSINIEPDGKAELLSPNSPKH
jgi:hypothetical protein